MVVQKLPVVWLQSHVPDIIKAALAVLKHLPTHASLEQAQLLKALTAVMHLVVPTVTESVAVLELCMITSPVSGHASLRQAQLLPLLSYARC